MARDEKVTIRWFLAHCKIAGNEKADEIAKAAAARRTQEEEVPDEYRWETSLSQMTKVSAKARSRTRTEWVADHIRRER